MVTALFQVLIVWASGSVALLDNTIIIMKMPQPQTLWVSPFIFLGKSCISVLLTVTAEKRISQA
jgi:hypothetical protein